MASKKYTQSIWQFMWSKWTILAMVFLVPLYASTAHWYPFTTPKTVLIIGGTLLASVFFVWGLLEHKEEHIRITYFHGVLAAFLAVMVVAGITGVNPHQSFFGTFYSSSSIVLLLVLGLLAVLIGEHVRRDSAFIRQLLTAVFLSGVLVAIITYVPFEHSSWKLLSLSRGGSTLGNSSFAGAFLLFAVGFGAYLVVVSKGWKKKCLYLLGMASIILCPIFLNADLWQGTVSVSQIIHSPLILKGQAQGATLGIIVAALVSGSLWLTLAQKKVFKILGASIFTMCILGIIIGYSALINPHSKIHQGFAEAKTATRFIFWDIAGKAIKAKPLLGYGFENYQTLYQEHFNPVVLSVDYTREQWVTNPHNIFYDIGVSAGWLGIITYMTLLLGACWVLFKRARAATDLSQKALVIFPGLLIGYTVQNFFIFDAPTSWLMYFICIGVALGAMVTVAKSAAAVSSTRLFVRNSLYVTFIVGASIGIIVFAWLPAHESRQWANVKSLPISAERITLQEHVQHISPMGSVDDETLYARGTLDTLDAARGTLKSEDKPIFLQEIDSLVAMLSREGKKYPDNFYVPYTAGMLTHLALVTDPVRGLPAVETARAYFLQAKNISPTNPRVYLNLAQNALFMNDVSTARTYIQQAIALGASDEGNAFLKKLQK